MPTKNLNAGRKMLCIQGFFSGRSEVLARIPFFVAGKVADPPSLNSLCAFLPNDSHLFDSKPETYWSPSEKRPELTITLPEDVPAALLQMEWYKPPEKTEVTVAGPSGEELLHETLETGFYVDAVPLPSGARTVVIHPRGTRVRMSSVRVYGEDYPHELVQRWKPMPQKLDILLFSTHYDDELLFFGGLIPYYSAVRGLRVQVAYMTSNYLTRFSNYRFRPHEALNGLWTACTHFYPVTNEVRDIGCETYWDAVSIYGTEQFVEFQVEQIRRFKPLVVVTQAENGEYGHGAHILTAFSVERAVEAAADPEQFPESAERYGVWDTPKTYLHLYGDRSESTMLNYELIAPELGLLSPFQVAQAAYRQHVTQQQWVAFYVYSYDHPHDSHRFGLYRSLVGPDEEKNDLMEHVSREAFPIG